MRRFVSACVLAVAAIVALHASAPGPLPADLADIKLTATGTLTPKYALAASLRREGIQGLRAGRRQRHHRVALPHQGLSVRRRSAKERPLRVHGQGPRPGRSRSRRVESFTSSSSAILKTKCITRSSSRRATRCCTWRSTRRTSTASASRVKRSGNGIPTPARTSSAGGRGISWIPHSIDSARTAGEWLHGNSLSIGPRGNIMLSFHYLNQVISIATDWKIVEWRLGGVRPTITVPPDQQTSAPAHGRGNRAEPAI